LLEDETKLTPKFVSPLSTEKIFITLDTHHFLHIAHAAFWVDGNGKNPAPFTPVTYEDAKAGKCKTAHIFSYLMQYLYTFFRDGFSENSQ
jgi:hypothetical protein